MASGALTGWAAAQGSNPSYDAHDPLTALRLHWPVRGPINSGFGTRRSSGERGDVHAGIDIGARAGTPVRAPASAIVAVANPSYARGWFFSGALRLWAGELELSTEHMETSLRLSPREREGNSHLLFIGAAHFFKRRFEEAASKFVLGIQETQYRPRPYQYLAACYAHMGRLDEAREVVARLRAITPLVVPDELPLRIPEHRELLLSGLRLAIGEMP